MDDRDHYGSTEIGYDDDDGGDGDGDGDGDLPFYCDKKSLKNVLKFF